MTAIRTLTLTLSVAAGQRIAERVKRAIALGNTVEVNGWTVSTAYPNPITLFTNGTMEVNTDQSRYASVFIAAGTPVRVVMR